MHFPARNDDEGASGGALQCGGHCELPFFQFLDEGYFFSNPRTVDLRAALARSSHSKNTHKFFSELSVESVTMQVAESLSAVGEEDYSTPAASDAGGSEHLTTSSRSATAAGFDPLGMVTRAPLSPPRSVSHPSDLLCSSRAVVCIMHALPLSGCWPGQSDIARLRGSCDCCKQRDNLLATMPTPWGQGRSVKGGGMSQPA